MHRILIGKRRGGGGRRAARAAGLGARIALLALLASAATAQQPAAEPEHELQPLMGSDQKVLVKPEETLLDIAFEYRLPFSLVSRANEALDPWIPVPGSVVVLPTRMVLPHVPHQGLVINIPEMRLYDFTAEPTEVFAAAIGDMADRSLLGSYRIGNKRKNPAWYVPKSIQEEDPTLPAVVPAGPDNPLGSRWMTIGSTTYGIHGTNVRWSIGRTATHGCIRLYEDEIQRLYERTPTGTPIRLVYQPFKWGTSHGLIWLEAHPDVYDLVEDPLGEALRVPRALGLLSEIDFEKVKQVVQEARGLPVRVGRLPEEPPQRNATTSTPTF